MTPYQKKMNQFHETRRLRNECQTLANWLMHPLTFVHERIVSDVDKALKPYLRDNTIT